MVSPMCILSERATCDYSCTMAKQSDYITSICTVNKPQADDINAGFTRFFPNQQNYRTTKQENAINYSFGLVQEDFLHPHTT
jgi:hypothetical protein